MALHDTPMGSTRDRAPAPDVSYETRRPLWMRFGLGLAFWTAIGLFFASQSAPMPWGGGFVMSMPRWYVWGLLTPLIWRTDRLLASGRSRNVRLLIHAPLGVVWTLFAIGILYALQPVLSGGYPDSVFFFVVQRFQLNLLIYGVIAGVIVARDYAQQAQGREREATRLSVRAAQLERSLVEARLETLRSQLHPHFLFNALNTISAFTEQEPRKARRLMAHLGDLLRSSLDHAAEPEITLRKELCFLEDYLEIERARFEDRVTVRVEVDETTLDALVPTFLLQPLVENAIRHGITACNERGTVEVSIRRLAGQLLLRVCDDGVGLPAGWRPDGKGVGLRNTAARLQELYPDAHSFAVTGAPTGGTLVEIVIPYHIAKELRSVAQPALAGAP